MIQRWAETRWSTIDKSRLRQSDGVECMGRKYRTAHRRRAGPVAACARKGLRCRGASRAKACTRLLAQSRELLKQMQAG